MIAYIIKYLLLFVCVLKVSSLEFKYHNNTELSLFLHEFVRNDKDGLHKRLYTIGRSRKGTPLEVVELSAAKERNIGMPNIKLIANIHGNEAVGREILLHFLEYLQHNYKSDPTVRYLLDNTYIHVLPTLNPDGYEISMEGLCMGEYGRYNGKKGRDLNRDFPDYYKRKNRQRQPETLAVMNWMSRKPFVLSACLHTGALVANYPFDTIMEKTSGSSYPESKTPDDDVFRHLATTYAQNHQTMYKGESCDGSTRGFKDGITNGAAWYPFAGGMQDYNYMEGCMELTLEIDCCKYPTADHLPKLWEQNKNALLQYSLQAHRGITGIVLDAETRLPIANATIKILDRDMTFKSFDTGEFWRLLLPGQYTLQVSKEGYGTASVTFEVEPPKEFPRLLNLTINLTNSFETTPLPTTPAQVISSYYGNLNTVETTLAQPNYEPAQIAMRSAFLQERSRSSSLSVYITYYLFLVLLLII